MVWGALSFSQVNLLLHDLEPEPANVYIVDPLAVVSDLNLQARSYNQKLLAIPLQGS
jgi:hypothetical protein